MKTTPFFASLLAAAHCSLAGCDVRRLREEVPRHPRSLRATAVAGFPADQKATYDAAKAALDQMGFRFVRGGPAAGRA